MKIFIVVFLLFLVAQVANSSDAVSVGETQFSIDRLNALHAVEASMDNIGGVLKRFKPQGAQIKNLKVEGNRLSFKVVKSILFSATVKAVVDVEKQNPACPSTSVAGYVVNLDLRQSDSIVADNIESMRIDLCVNDLGTDKLSIVGKGFVGKAPNFSTAVGGALVSGMGEQVPAMAQAIKAEVMAQP